MDLGHDDAELHGDVAPERLDAVEQIAAALGLHEVDELEPELERERFDAEVGGQRLGGVGGGCGRCRLGRLGRGGDVLGQAGPEHAHGRADDEERQLGQAGDDGQAQHHDAGRLHDAPVARQLAEHVMTEVVLGGGPGHDDAGREREQQRRDLRDQPVTDREQAVGADGLRERQMVLEDPDGQAPDQIDHGDDDGGDGVAADELGRAVHGAVEVGLVGHLLAATASALLVDDAGVQVGIDGHLLARHAVEREAGRHLGHPAGA